MVFAKEFLGFPQNLLFCRFQGKEIQFIIFRVGASAVKLKVLKWSSCHYF